MVLMLMFC
ncbi:unnamed protein product [Fusarium fujikuroi]|uniref:Uncharacterized protein n=1 Tax=Fusarium fujikuroi TaxID=5127 RepID=A0A9Q9UFU7_FUSFU|nr:unnamed protein product [Fusarium fujikuroi]